MEKFIYEIEEEPIYPNEVEYRVKFKRVVSFLWFKWYSYQMNKYIDKNNRACQWNNAFVANSKDEINSFLLWVKKLDGTL